MKIIENIAKWLCSKLTRNQMVLLVGFLNNVLNDSSSVFKIPDPKLPNYRNFVVDPEPPLKYDSDNKIRLNYKEIIKQRNINPVSHRCKNRPEKHIRCPHCKATYEYIYINNGNERKSIQYRCKVCKKTFCETLRRTVTKYVCPICKHALYKWKTRFLVTIYKCGNDSCPRYIENKNKLSDEEKVVQKEKNSQFKLRYSFREYNLKLRELFKNELDLLPLKQLSKFRFSLSTIGLVLTFYITLKQSSRMTAFALNRIFGIKISHTTVARIANAASYLCHKFNVENIPKVHGKQAADETYIKVKGKHHYAWIAVAEHRSIITAYMVSDDRGEIPAVKTVYMASQKQIDNSENNPLVFITDGNPSYQAAVTYLKSEGINISHKQVIGLKNDDEVSAKYRFLKNTIERVNRTYNHYTKNNFQIIRGASAHLALSVTNYNFIRPHSSLNKQPPVVDDKLSKIDLIQNLWAEILKSAA